MNTHPKPYSSNNIKILPKNEFPRLLSEIPDKPKTLYYCGNLELVNKPDTIFLCVVGSRKYSNYGYDACTQLLSALKDKPVVIVSGLALGIDGIAHKTALSVGLPCIAVPGSGLDPNTIYPRSHVGLANEIVSKGGLLISEYEPQFRASPWSFPMRNRIMAGLSHAVLVIEGESDSGTLITARLALEYNRDVLALPGSIFSSTSDGPLSLIKRGAVPICNENDLLQALGFETTQNELHDEAKRSEIYNKCSPEELKLLQILSDTQANSEKISREQLFEKTQLELSKFQVIYSMLEIRNLIVEEYGLVKLL